MKNHSRLRRTAAVTFAMTVGAAPEPARRYLARLQLDQPSGQREKMIQKLIVSELIAGGYV